MKHTTKIEADTRSAIMEYAVLNYPPGVTHKEAELFVRQRLSYQSVPRHYAWESPMATVRAHAVRLAQGETLEGSRATGERMICARAQHAIGIDDAGY